MHTRCGTDADTNGKPSEGKPKQSERSPSHKWRETKYSAIDVSDITKIHISYDIMGIVPYFGTEPKYILCASNLYDGWSLYST